MQQTNRTRAQRVRQPVQDGIPIRLNEVEVQGACRRGLTSLGRRCRRRGCDLPGPGFSYAFFFTDAPVAPFSRAISSSMFMKCSLKAKRRAEASRSVRGESLFLMDQRSLSRVVMA